MPKSPKPTSRRSGSSDAVRRIDEACRRAVLGKLAVRDIAGWVSAFGVSETEFRLLWRLFAAEDVSRSAPELDQSELAAVLAVSPAQVSGVVDRLRQASRIAEAPTDDRRRHVWRLTPAGRELLQDIVVAVAEVAVAPRDKEAA